MKNKTIYEFIFILLVGILIFIPKDTYALDYTVGDTTYTVNSGETFRDYYYFTYVKGNYDYMFCGTGTLDSGNPTSLFCYYLGNDNRYIYGINFTSQIQIWNSSVNNSRTYSDSSLSGKFIRFSNFNNVESSNTTAIGLYYKNNNNEFYPYYSNFNLREIDTVDTIFYPSNFTFNDIECSYHTSDCNSSGGGGNEEPEPEEPEPEEPTVDSSSNMTYVYIGMTGLALISVFIWLKFFRYCFHIRKEKL